jgi:PBP1b-binding outer membrane lipoprotein LpoB
MVVVVMRRMPSTLRSSNTEAKMSRSALVLALAGPLLLAGCASEDSVKQAQATADAAKAQADKAMATAQQALQTAQSANQAAQMAEQKANQMFQQSLKK